MFTPLTKEQYQKALNAGFTSQQIIENEKKRKSLEGGTTLMQMATKPKQQLQPVQPVERETAILPPTDMSEAQPNVDTAVKTAGNIGKSFLSNVWGLVKGVVTSPYTAAKTAWDIGQSIAQAEQEGVKFKDVLTSVPEGLKTLLPPALQKKSFYEGTKSLAEDPFQLLPYGLMLKGITDKAVPKTETKPITEKIIKTDNEIVGKILQGKSTDVAKGARALQTVDTANIKTYSDLSNIFKSKIENLAKTVDERFTDETPQPLAELTIKTNVGGKIVSANYTDMALKALKEVYDKTNDPVNAERINQIIEKANKTGLTAKEVNYIAREFGSEFKGKAFSKTGDPLTSVNAQGAENIRSGVKNTARQLMPDAGTRAIDAQITDLYSVKRLSDKMVESVNKLEQRVQKRNLGQKIGRVLGIAFDVASGGIAKGFMKKILLESNVGLKTMNAIDIQNALSKNLRIIDKLNSAKTDFEFVYQLTNYIKENKKALEIESGLGGIQSKKQ
jgi:hypothetical protein